MSPKVMKTVRTAGIDNRAKEEGGSILAGGREGKMEILGYG
jgi:hypothetical protein